MRQQMTPQVENFYARQIDRKRPGNRELKNQGIPAEKFVALFYDGIAGLKARVSTLEEDKGPEIGGRQTVDLVVYFSDSRPAFATQITSSAQKEILNKKIKEMQDHPFIRLDEMKPGDLSIPKVLVFLEARQIQNFFKNPDSARNPELFLKIIDDHIRSLSFDLSRTQNPLEQNAVKMLIDLFAEEKKKYIH